MKRIILITLIALKCSFLINAQETPDFIKKYEPSTGLFSKELISSSINAELINPDDFEGFYKRGILNLQNGLFAEAIESFRKLILPVPDIVGATEEIAEPYYYIGLCKAQMKEYDSAMYYYNKALELMPAYPEAYNERGVLKIQNNDYKGAAGDFEKAIQYDNSFAFAHYNLAYLVYLSGNKRGSKKILRKMNRKFEEFHGSRMLLGLIYFEEHKLHMAEGQFTEAIKINHEVLIAFYLRGLTRMVLGFTSGGYPYLLSAYIDLDLANKLDPEFPMAYELKGLIDQAQGNYALAAENRFLSLIYRMQDSTLQAMASPADWIKLDIAKIYFDSANITREDRNITQAYFMDFSTMNEFEKNRHIRKRPELNPRNELTAKIQLLQYIQEEQIDSLTALLPKVLVFDSTSMHVLAIKAAILCEDGKTEEGLALIDKLISQNPENAYLRLLMGNQQSAVSRYEEAIEEYNKALEIAHTYTDLFLQRAKAYAAMEQYDSTLADVEMYLQFYPENAYAWYLGGFANYNLDLPGAAIKMLDKCINIDPAYFPAYHFKALSYLLKNEKQKAIQSFSPLVYTMGPLGLYMRGEFKMTELNDPEGALSDFERANTYNPPSGFLYEAMGDAYRKMDKMNYAVHFYNEALACDSSDASPLIKIGDLHSHRKTYDKAIMSYEKALETDSVNMYALSGLGYCLVQVEDYNRALGCYLDATRLDTTDATAYGNTGWCYYLLGDIDQCIAYSEKAIALDSTSHFARFNIAFAVLHQGDYEKAQILYKQSYYRASADKEWDPEGAIADLQDLIEKGIMAEEAKAVLKEIFGVE